MSLIVAQTTESGPSIVSDTRVTFEWERASFKTGTLKAIIVSPTVTICFAGDVGAGLDGVRNFARHLIAGTGLDDLLPHLQKLTTDQRRSVEFIIASSGAESTLTRIRGGEIEINLLTAWIGDQDGFERFQEERHSGVNPKSETTS
jgi:hypothetical protein